MTTIKRPHRCAPPSAVNDGEVWECEECFARWKCHVCANVYHCGWRRTIPDMLGGRLRRVLSVE